MSMQQRYEVTLDGAGGVGVIDRLLDATRYTQVFGIKKDVELLYEGLRLIIPIVMSEELKAVEPPPVWVALKQLEAAHKVVFIVVSRRVAAFDDTRRKLNLFSELARSVIGWSLLPLLVEESSTLTSEGLFIAAMDALQNLWRGAVTPTMPTSDSDWLKAILRAPYVAAAQKTEIAAVASREYLTKDYGSKRLASFIEYYADNSLTEVESRARRFAARSIDGGKLVAKLSDALAAKQPFSFVRVGEGEGCFLSYPRYVTDRTPRNEVFGVCAKDIYRIWFERNINDVAIEELSALRNLFWKAIHSADVIGVPTPERVIFEQAHFVDDVERHGFSRGYVGVSEILSQMEQALQANQLDGKLFADCDIARPLYEWQDWNQSLATTLPHILKGRRGVTFVTCHAHLAPALQCMLDLQDVHTLTIPPERGRVKGDGHLEGDHYRDHFNQICESLWRNATPIVVVAAGFLGKAYCAAAKEAGSVAIDIGSLADYWIGISTRQKNTWSMPSPFVMT